MFNERLNNRVKCWRMEVYFNFKTNHVRVSRCILYQSNRSQLGAITTIQFWFQTNNKHYSIIPTPHAQLLNDGRWSNFEKSFFYYYYAVIATTQFDPPTKHGNSWAFFTVVIESYCCLFHSMDRRNNSFHLQW